MLEVGVVGKIYMLHTARKIPWLNQVIIVADIDILHSLTETLLLGRHLVSELVITFCKTLTDYCLWNFVILFEAKYQPIS